MQLQTAEQMLKAEPHSVSIVTGAGRDGVPHALTQGHVMKD